MSIAKEDLLRVPGAELFYRVRGSGPVLLILQGGDGTAEGSDGIAGRIADGYTVITYDRRGLSRSKLDDASAAPRGLETHCDDAHRLLAALAEGPAFVVGFSLGALLGLELAARHPGQVRLLIAHEPPATQFLPDAERAEAGRAQEDVEDAYRREGVAAAMQRFVALAGLDFHDREPDVELARPDPQRVPNLKFFLEHDAPAVRRHMLDIDALRAVSSRIVLAGGRTSGQYLAYRCAEALARRLGTEVVEFPGGHSGFVTHPRAFAGRLLEVLGHQAEG